MTIKIGKRMLIIISVVIVLLLMVAWYFYSIKASYELKLFCKQDLWATGEEHPLWIGFQKYTFLLETTGNRIGGEWVLTLTVTSGNNTETRSIGTPSASVGKTFKFLDLEIFVKEALVDGLRIVVRKW